MRFRGIARVASMLAFVALTAALVPGATGASNGKPSFGADVVLPGGQGGEPSYAIDTSATSSRAAITISDRVRPFAPV